MPYWAAFPAIGPITHIRSDPATYWRHPLATGPYKFGKYVPGKSLTLVRNDQWDPTTDPGRHAYPDRYVFKFHQDIGRMESTILGGAAQGRTALSFDNVSAANRARAKRLVRLTPGLASCAHMLWADNRKITDVRVRRALGYAFPYRQVAALVDDEFGFSALPGTSILPPGIPGRQDYSALHAEQGQTRPHMARTLLRRAGYAPGDYAITFAYADAPGAAVDAAVKDQLVKSLQAAGFATHPIHAATLDEYIAVQNDPHSPVNARMESWCADWPSGSSFLPTFFASNGGQNNAYFSKPEVDASINRISSLPLEQQPPEWGKLDEHIMKTYYPGVILYNTQVDMLHGSRIGGMNDDSSVGMPTWKDLYVRH
jgi:peptide/nickel transport system substrate-binding protein